MWGLVDEVDNGPADFEGLQRFLGIFVDIVIGLDEFELFVLIGEFQLVYLGQQIHPIDQLIQSLDLDVALVSVYEVGAGLKHSLLELTHVLVRNLVEDFVL